jgi:hypothetical protein
MPPARSTNPTGVPASANDPPVATAEFEQPNLPRFAARRPTRPGEKSLPYEQLQRRRWGKYGADAAIGIEHDVSIRVEAQRLIIDETFAVPAPVDVTRTDLFDRLLAVIDRQANTWGQAPHGFFWVPSLKFVIAPDATAVYDRIAPLVSKSGLVSKAEFARD